MVRGAPKQPPPQGWAPPQAPNAPGIAAHQPPSSASASARPSQHALGFSHDDGSGKALGSHRSEQSTAAVGGITPSGGGGRAEDPKAHSSKPADGRPKASASKDAVQVNQIAPPQMAWKQGGPAGNPPMVAKPRGDSQSKVSGPPGPTMGGMQASADTKKVPEQVIGQGVPQGRPGQAPQYQHPLPQQQSQQAGQAQRPQERAPHEYQRLPKHQQPPSQQPPPQFQSPGHQQQSQQAQQARPATLSQQAMPSSGAPAAGVYPTYAAPGAAPVARAPSYGDMDVQGVYKPATRSTTGAPSTMAHPSSPNVTWGSQAQTQAQSSSPPAMPVGGVPVGEAAGAPNVGSSPWPAGSMGQVAVQLSGPGAGPQNSSPTHPMQPGAPGRQDVSPHGLNAPASRVVPVGGQGLGVNPRGQMGVEQQQPPQQQQQPPPQQQQQQQQHVTPMNGGVQNAVPAAMLPMVSGQQAMQNVQVCCWALHAVSE